MAQTDSITSICNAGLVALGEDLIASLSDATKRAKLCAAKYDQVRREVLRMHPWSCAKALAQLPALATPPVFGRSNAFALPADFLRLWDIDGDTFDTLGWELNGNQIHTDDGGPLNLVYVRDLQDTTQMDALLCRCIALALARDIAIPLTQSDDKQQKMAALLADTLPDARLVTSQESSPREFDDDVWLRSRYY